MSFVVKERCPDCGRTFKNLSNHKICQSRGSGKHANKLSMVQRQVCPDCGRDFVNLANHKVCHGRGAGNRQTSYPPEAVPWQRVPTPTDIDRDHWNADFTPRPPHWDTPPPITPPSRRERRTPAATPHPSNRERQAPTPTPRQSNRERQTPASTPHHSNRERWTPAPMTPPFTPQTPAPTPGPFQTERQTSPPTPPPSHSEIPMPPFYFPLSYTERLTPPPTPPPLPREEPTPPLYIPLSHGDRRTPSPTAPLYLTIPTFPHHDDNNHNQSRLNQSQAGRHDRHGSYSQEPQQSRRQREHQQRRQPHQHPHHPFIQGEHQHGIQADYRPRPHGRFSDLLEGQQSWRGRNSYNGSLSDEDALAVAIAASQNPEEADLGRSLRDEPDINAVPTGSQRLVQEHLSRCMEFGASQISVNRDNIWSSSMAFFKDVCVSKTAKQLMVAFTDSDGRREECIDTGGPRREYLRLLLESIVANSKMLHGDEKQGFLIRPNISAYSKKHFRVIGVMLATIIAQGGQPPAIFAPPVVDAILDKDEMPSVDHVPDTRKRESLKKVSEARDEAELQEALEECDWRYDLDGVPSYVTMASRDEFLRGCVQYFVILQSKPMLDQLIQGLGHCGILDLIRRHTLRDLLEYKSDVEVTAERVMDLLKPDERCHSDEQQILENLSRFLQAAEGGSLCDVLRESQRLTRSQTEFARGLTPARLLAFVTGCSREPAGGFVPKPSIVFNRAAWRLPSAATCSNQILITVHQNSLEFHRFCQAMMTSMMNGENFTTA
ncbi:uncharacterized protein LOC124290763 isoform X3 [Haliotis rubra]|uniref:uncharacterized protein LOC124290763 isoform X2 n=1 Tax=Haliotis rubra TaxID=36100 RepID=UPI001EE51F8F|nr:uncharacterized protein LOC124290763 isoform X2 [Haliotis rubra]XP_046583543.1 uncharacterized protein LOC124290763 isoform X3 [Haliotis rubra]